MTDMKSIKNLGESHTHTEWFRELQDYARIRYQSIEDQYTDTFSYVTPKEENRFSYSFEYASILRDIGSVFDSTLKRIIKKGELEYSEDIGGQLKLLRDLEPDLKFICIYFKSARQSRNNLYPFKPSLDGIPMWWHAYNNVKHFEVENEKDGNFENVTNGMAGLYTIKWAIWNPSSTLFKVSRIPSIHGKSQYGYEFFKHLDPARARNARVRAR